MHSRANGRTYIGTYVRMHQKHLVSQSLEAPHFVDVNSLYSAPARTVVQYTAVETTTKSKLAVVVLT